jgi:hypothetical protein
MTRSDTPRIAYNFAIVRVIPHVASGAFIDIGVILHARTAEYLDMQVIPDPERLRPHCHDLDTDLLFRYLRAAEAICRGHEDGGPVALLPPSERFHWLTAPRSDVLQCSPVHEGLCADPAAELRRLYSHYVGE